MYYAVITDNNKQLVLITHNGRTVTVPHTHPNFDQIEEALNSGGDERQVLQLVQSPEHELNNANNDRVYMERGLIVVDGKPVQNELSHRILDFMERGNTEYISLMRFYENLLRNSSAKIRAELYPWIVSTSSYEINSYGKIEGVVPVSEQTKSVSKMSAQVNGANYVEDYIPYWGGAIVNILPELILNLEIPGLEIEPPACSTRREQTSYALVDVDPMDVLSFSNNSSSMFVQKFQVREFCDSSSW